jgi:predicted  nucleic acid-binding Zn-ribbon protein
MNKVDLCKKISEVSDKIQDLEEEIADYAASYKASTEELSEARQELRLLIQKLDTDHESINDVDVDENP